MKIGLFSPHYAFNYGAVLQAFALKHYLRTIGHDAIILNRRPVYQCDIPSWCGRMARGIEVLSKKSSFGKFERKYLQPQTSAVIHQQDWNNIDLDDFDAIIVGSDQVWRDNYVFHAFGFNLFLDFIDGHKIKKIAYAPSLGKESWNATPEVERKVKQLLSDFNAISVREFSSIRILKEKFGVDTSLVLDPTMLLTSDNYRTVFKLSQSNTKYIAAYMLDYNSDLELKINEISDNLSLPVNLIKMTSPQNKVAVFLNRFRPMQSVVTWLENMANADYIVTNSFHGLVFSIIFRKQFVVFMNSERGGARFKSLLAMFGLENRLVNMEDSKYIDILKISIDYSSIETLIEKWRRISFAFLDNALAK